MQALFGESILDLKYYLLRELELEGFPLVVSRTGWSRELGYELCTHKCARGEALRDKIMASVAPIGQQPGHTSSIRRIEDTIYLNMRTQISTPTSMSWGLIGWSI